ncbi:MAG: phospholipase A [Paraglaciecola sp.]|nr:phospholipase A [Paraglaciecola sp.]MDP5132556.1 phospholipase A [Paraglaciecola sp.]
MKTLILVLFCTSINAQEIEQSEAQQTQAGESILNVRSKADNAAVANPFSIAQHRLNYLLPVSWVGQPNDISADGINDGNLDSFEAKYQISMKLPLYLHDKDSSGLYFGFTAMSFWQVYNSEVSKPFRETNYEPEIFYSWQKEIKLLGFEFNQLQAGFNHQSNGQSGLRSRSWNRLFVSTLFSDENAFYYVKAWYRIPEDAKENPMDTNGDDNPDITDFLGHVELGFGTKIANIDVLTLLRNNLKTNDNKGSIELNLSYPINDRYNVLLQYFNGYGDSLIDYNHHQQRISLGFQLAFF